MKVKIPHALIKLVLKIPLNVAKRVILLIFSLEKSNSRAITHALTKTQASVTIIILSVAKMVGEQVMPPSQVRFSNYFTMNHFTVFFLYKSTVK